MKKLIAMKLLLVSLFMMSFPVQTQAQAAERIKFQRGKYAKVITGKVGKNQEKRYVIGLNRNQKLTVGFTRKTQYVFITVKDGRGNILKEDDNGYVEMTTGYIGDYYIVISTKYGQADSFTFRVEAR